MAIHLGRSSPSASRDRPERRRGRPARRREPRLIPPAAPTWSCSRWGLPCRHRCRRRGALLPHHFTLAARPAPRTGPIGLGGVFSVALSPGSPPPGVTRHRASVEPGLSSLHPSRKPGRRAAIRPSGWEDLGCRAPPVKQALPQSRGSPPYERDKAERGGRALVTAAGQVERRDQAGVAVEPAIGNAVDPSRCIEAGISVTPRPAATRLRVDSMRGASWPICGL